MEAGPGHMPLVSIRRDLGSGSFEQGAVADGAAPDADRPVRDLELFRIEHSRLILQHEDLAAPGIDDRQGSGGAGGERVECRDAGRRNAQGERQATRGRETDANTGEAARPDADREGFDLTRLRT